MSRYAENGSPTSRAGVIGMSARRSGGSVPDRGVSRRSMLFGSGAAAAFGAAAFLTGCSSSSNSGGATGTSTSASSGSKGLRQVTVAQGIAAPTPAQAWMYSIPGGVAHFFQQEGLDVTNQGLDGGSDSIAALISGRAQFAAQSSSIVYTSVAKGVGLKAFICDIPKDFTAIAVLDSSPITEISQLKGKTIGINAVGGNPEIEVESITNALGWKVGTDIHLLPVGTGAPAIIALQNNRVQALGLWHPIYAQLEQQTGVKLREFVPPPIPSIGFEHSYVTMDTTIANDPKLVESLTRALAKSLVFQAAADPAELVKSFYALYPSTKPTGLSDSDVIAAGVAGIEGGLPFFDYQDRVFSRKQQLGDESDAVIEAVGQIFKQAGQIDQVLPASSYFTRQFVPYANDFDFAPILAQGKAYKFTG
jgi:NitT/TauT family transport system substrate-binding protein